MKHPVTIFIGVLIAVIVSTAAIVAMAYVIIRIFPSSPNLNDKSIEICRQKGGTPVLEGYGSAYKSCAINGESHTGNYVTH